MSSPWLLTDLILNLLISLSLFAYGFYTRFSLKIRLNLLTRIKWWVALSAILIKLALSMSAYIQNAVNLTPWFISATFLISQAHFMIILMLFLTVFGSWHVFTSMNPTDQSDALVEDPEKTTLKLQQQKRLLNVQSLYF